jgi:hypothetical protein
MLIRRLLVVFCTLQALLSHLGPDRGGQAPLAILVAGVVPSFENPGSFQFSYSLLVPPSSLLPGPRFRFHLNHIVGPFHSFSAAICFHHPGCQLQPLHSRLSRLQVTAAVTVPLPLSDSHHSLCVFDRQRHKHGHWNRSLQPGPEIPPSFPKVPRGNRHSSIQQ